MVEDAVIETRELSKRYGKRWVVDNLDLAVPRGAVYGFLGLNGAGKSTTIRMLMGLIRQQAGNASVLGFDPHQNGVAMKERVGYVPEAPVFYPWMTIGQLCDFVAYYRPRRWDHRHAASLINRFRIPRDTPFKDMSKGQRAKAALVLALGFNPELLILDEPTSGLDPVARREFVEGILADFQDTGHTVFISSHLVNELSGLVDHVGILHEGRLKISQPVDEFLAGMQRIRLSFEGDPPADLACEGLLRKQTLGREAVLSVRTADINAAKARLQALRPASMAVEPMHLEDAFVEYVGALERGSL